ncbi:hypothetical protein B0H11DRAFT_1944128 [Mycena galericulata]|nr:hypothetical protein B0H11DRAFT_1944128 [Mycena galericulata]
MTVKSGRLKGDFVEVSRGASRAKHHWATEAWIGGSEQKREGIPDWERGNSTVGHSSVTERRVTVTPLPTDPDYSSAAVDGEDTSAGIQSERDETQVIATRPTPNAEPHLLYLQCLLGTEKDNNKLLTQEVSALGLEIQKLKIQMEGLESENTGFAAELLNTQGWTSAKKQLNELRSLQTNTREIEELEAELYRYREKLSVVDAAKEPEEEISRRTAEDVGLREISIESGLNDNGLSPKGENVHQTPLRDELPSIPEFDPAQDCQYLCGGSANDFKLGYVRVCGSIGVENSLSLIAQVSVWGFETNGDRFLIYRCGGNDLEFIVIVRRGRRDPDGLVNVRGSNKKTLTKWKKTRLCSSLLER